MVEASLDSNPDLFWAIRGAGANFGVVTSATYKVHPLTNEGNILEAEFIIPANMTSAYFKAVESYNGKLPAELASLTLISYNASTSEVMFSPWCFASCPLLMGVCRHKFLLDGHTSDQKKKD